MIYVTIQEAKNRLTELGKRVHRGETVVITRNGEPYLDLIPSRRESLSPRIPGMLKGQIEIAEHFDDSMDLVSGYHEKLERLRLLLQDGINQSERGEFFELHSNDELSQFFEDLKKEADKNSPS